MNLQICTTLCVHSLYSYWRDEKSVVRSLQELSQSQARRQLTYCQILSNNFNFPGPFLPLQTNVAALHSNSLLVDYDKAASPSHPLSFYNAAYHGSQHQGSNYITVS